MISHKRQFENPNSRFPLYEIMQTKILKVAIVILTTAMFCDLQRLF
jgi:hypothetical protein